jgi:hypothetical protein
MPALRWRFFGPMSAWNFDDGMSAVGGGLKRLMQTSANGAIAAMVRTEQPLHVINLNCH